MFRKRHIVFTAVASVIITMTACNIFGGQRLKREQLKDPVSAAKQIILSQYVDKLTEEQIGKLDDAAIEAMVNELKDPYSKYLGESAFDSYNESNEEDYVGVGMEVLYTAGSNAITVMSPYDGSPAQKAGILPGDNIIEVDGEKVSDETYDSIVSHIRGKGVEEGTKISFRIVREGEAEPIALEAVREHVDVQTVRFEKIGDVGYIKIAEFINRTEEEFLAAVETLKDMDSTSLIIDLRNNPGGYAHTVISMCDMLLPEGIIAYLEDSDGKRKYFNSDENELGLPMAILINGGTASASELLAGSVQAYGLGIVVGEKSYGKAVGQTPYPLSEKTALYLTNARYFTPKGECIDGEGITPDIEVALPAEKMARLYNLPKEEDDQLMAALEALGK